MTEPLAVNSESRHQWRYDFDSRSGGEDGPEWAIFGPNDEDIGYVWLESDARQIVEQHNALLSDGQSVSAGKGSRG